MLKIIMIILMFALIVVIHEWGHFIAARLFRVKVNEFAVGMGPKLWSKQKGETLYSVRALPIGGFCSMEGEDATSTDPASILNKKAWQKLIIFAAGALMNFLLAWILMSVIVGYSGVASNQIEFIEFGKPVQEAGLEVNDTILEVNGIKVQNFNEIITEIQKPSTKYKFVVEKPDGSTVTMDIIPDVQEDGSNLFGFSVKKVTPGVLGIVTEGFKETVLVIEQTLRGFVELITGKVEVDELAGIVGVVQISSNAWDQGLEVSLLAAIMQIVYIGAFLSANLGVFNLLPIPALDGGRIIFALIEMVRRKPIDPEKEGMVHFIGIVLLMILMVIVLYNDIVRAIG